MKTSQMCLEACGDTWGTSTQPQGDALGFLPQLLLTPTDVAAFRRLGPAPELLDQGASRGSSILPERAAMRGLGIIGVPFLNS